MRRSRVALVLLGLLLGALLTATGAVAHHTRGKIVRWDLVEIANGTAVAGGENVATDPVTGESITVTGSGHVRPRSHEAFGGGAYGFEGAGGKEIGDRSDPGTKVVMFRGV